MKELNSILKIKETDKRLDNIESNFIEADYKVLEGEQLIANTNDGYTKDIKISGQSVLNVAPIKGPVDITAELSGTGTDITFEGTSEGYVDGVVIKGKTYQNLIEEKCVALRIGTWDTFIDNGIHLFKPNNEYTVIVDILSNKLLTGSTTLTGNTANQSTIFMDSGMIYIHPGDSGRKIVKMTTKPDLSQLNRILFWSHDPATVTGECTVSTSILEGDHTANTDINEYFEGIAGVGDKGKNLFDKNDVIMDSRVSEVSGSILSGFPDTIVSGISKVKPSTNYVIDGRESYSGVYAYGKNMEYINSISSSSSSSSFTTPDYAYFVRFHIESNQDLNRIQLEEGTAHTPYEEYYDGVAIEVKSCGKNLFKGDWVNGAYDRVTGAEIVSSTQVRSEYQIPIDSSKTYKVSNDGLSRNTNVFEYDKNNRFLRFVESLNSGVYTPDRDVSFINLSGNPDKRDKFQIEEGTAITTYDPYKEHKAQTVLQSPLMSLPSGVCDEIVDGSVIRRIGKTILDGSEPWEHSTLNAETKKFYYSHYFKEDFKPGFDSGIISDKFIYAPWKNENNQDYEFISCSGSATPAATIKILKSKLATPDVAGFKKWLSENNTTVWYELATPEVTNIRKEQFKLKTYNTRTSISTNTLITPELNINSIGLRKTALIKTETKYQFKFKRVSGTNPITVDLGGTKKVLANESTVMITTPATLSHDELRISGYNVKVENVMTTEGESSCTYADGIASVGDKGKNLFDKSDVIIGKCVDAINEIIVNTNFKLGVFEIDVKGLSSITYSGIKNATELVTQSSGGCQTYLFKNNRGLLFGSKYTSNNKADTTITIPSNAESLIITVCLATMHLIQLEEGNIATLYEPYTDGVDIEVESCGKNLFDIEGFYNQLYNINPYNIINVINEGLSCFGITNYNAYCNNGYRVNWKEKTAYSISGIGKSEFANGGVLVIKYTDDTFLKILTKIPNSFSEINCVSDPNKTISHIGSYYADKSMSFIVKDTIQIEECTESSPYTPHASDTLKLRLPEPLRSLPNGVSDTIEKENGEWMVVRRCGEIILDGSKTWVLKRADSGITCCETPVSDKNIGYLDYNSPSIIDTNAILHNAWDTAKWNNERADMAFNTNNSPGYLQMICRARMGLKTADDYKRYLTANPTTVIYKLAQPTTHPLNTLQLPNGVVDEVKNGKLIKKIGKVVLDGGEEWESSNFIENDPYISFLSRVLINNKNYNEDYLKSNLISDRFIGKASVNNTSDCESVQASSAVTVLYVKINKLRLSTPDIAGFKKWLSENPTTVWYELATPIELDYKSENLNLKTYKDTTHFYSNTNVNPDLAIKLLENDNLSTSVKNLYDYIARLEKQVSILTKNGVLFE